MQQLQFLQELLRIGQQGLLNGSSGLDRNFPKGFKFGAATSAYQIEGAWNASGKGENIWDRTTHIHPEAIVGGANGDVACDSYHNWRRDVEMVHEMGLHFYRFSISWTRLLPNAFTKQISESGKKYYDDLINYILEKGIEPIVTLYHWDLPQKLQDLGGWTNPLISDWFADYARVVFSLYADRVKTWITINEPNMLCEINYNLAFYAPLILEPEMAGLLCNKHVLVAHAKAYRIYEKEYKPMYHGKISISSLLFWMGPKADGDEELAELAMQGCVGQYSHAIYSKEGGWPPSVEKAMAEYSKRAGYARSKLPEFTKGEISLIKGTADFFAFNYYTSRLVRRATPRDKPGVWFITGRQEFDIILESDPSWIVMGNHITPIYAKGLRKVVMWLKENYGDLEFFITENGCGGGELNDVQRMKYINSHLEQVLLSIKEDGTNITGYTYWTLMDNFEWMDGYDLKFGLYEVDFKDPKRARSPRASAHYFSHIAKKNSLDVPFPKIHRRHHRTHNSSSKGQKHSIHFHYIFLLIVIFIY